MEGSFFVTSTWGDTTGGVLRTALVHLSSFVFLKVVNPENNTSSSDEEEEQQHMELDEEMENEICRVWDMSMDEVRGRRGK